MEPKGYPNFPQDASPLDHALEVVPARQPLFLERRQPQDNLPLIVPESLVPESSYLVPQEGAI